MCWGDSSGSIAINTYGGTQPYSWNWSNGYTGSTNTQLSPGTYTCTISDAQGCSLSDTFVLGSSQPLSIDLEADLNTATILATVNGGTLPYEYLWNNNSIDSMLVQVQSGFYTVTVTDHSGCTSEASLSYYLPLEIPTAITPNGDNINDTWEVKGIAAYNEVVIEIFNRWGDRVFTFNGTGLEYTDKTKQWDGNHNSHGMPAGVYLFILKIQEIEEPFQGTITLLR
jgi:gliding motility-associated-like protein